MPRGGDRRHPADCKCGACPKPGPKPKPKPDAPPLTKSVAAELYALAETKQRWQALRDTPDAGLRFQVEREISHQAGHKPVHNVNHMHDEPILMNVTLSLGERMKKGMEEAEKRVSGRSGL